MFAGLPSLTHEQQQQAVDRIQELMAQGLSSGQAITQVAEEMRATAQPIRATVSSPVLRMMRTSRVNLPISIADMEK